MAPATILSLPNEILLAIVDTISGDFSRERQRFLLTMSLVNRKFSDFARELLLSRPVVNIYNTRPLVEAYVRYPKIAAKVHVLEFHSSPVVWGRIDLAESTSRTRPTQDLLPFYRLIIDNSGVEDKYTWLKALEEGSCEAYLGVLMTMLPNVESLLLASVHDRDYFPLDLLFAPRWPYNSQTLQLQLRGYFAQCLERVPHRLKSLEAPKAWLNGGFDGNLTHLTSFQHLTIPDLMCKVYPSHKIDPFAIKVLAILPPNLRTLTMGQVQEDLLDEMLLDFAHAPSNKLIHLRQVIYYCDFQTRGPPLIEEEEINTYRRWRYLKNRLRTRSTNVKPAKARGRDFKILYTPRGTFLKHMMDLAQEAFPTTFVENLVRPGGPFRTYQRPEVQGIWSLQTRGLLDGIREAASEKDRAKRMARLETRKLRLQQGVIDGN